MRGLLSSNSRRLSFEQHNASGGVPQRKTWDTFIGRDSSPTHVGCDRYSIQHLPAVTKTRLVIDRCKHAYSRHEHGNVFRQIKQRTTCITHRKKREKTLSAT